MKTLIKYILLFTFPVFLNAQIHECDFDHLITETDRQALLKNIRETLHLKYNHESESGLRSNAVNLIEIPVTGHALANTLGQTSATLADFISAIDYANQIFANIPNLNIEFVLCDDITTIVNDNWFNEIGTSEFYEAGTGWQALTYVNGRLNLYIANNLEKTAFGFPGFAVIKTSLINHKTFIHELGHSFSLAHTFHPYDIIPDPSTVSYPISVFELVIRTTDPGLTYPYPNCEFVDAANSPYTTPTGQGITLNAGDGFCDTPADPNNWSNLDASTCSFTTNNSPAGVDLNGQDFEPDPTNFMSYAGDCRTTFSPDQITVIREFAMNNYDNFNCTFVNIVTETISDDVLRMPDEAGVNEVEIKFTHFEDNDCNSLTGFSCSPPLTDNSGLFTCDNFPISGFVNSELSKEGNWHDGLTTFDLVLVNRHILQITPLDGWSQIAADLNNSGSVTTVDAFELRKLILGVSSSPEVGDLGAPWRFMPELVEYFNPDHFTANFAQTPFNISNPIYSYPEYLEADYCYPASVSQVDEIGFHAIKVGDVNQSANPLSFTDEKTDHRNKETLIIKNNKTFEAGESFSVTVSADHFYDIVAYGIGMRIDPERLVLKNINKGMLSDFDPNNFSNKGLNNGEFKAIWIDKKLEGQYLNESDGLFKLDFETLQPIKDLQDVIQIDESILKKEFINSKDQIVKTTITLLVEEQKSLPEQFEMSIFPNPIEDEIVIDFVKTIDESLETKVVIFDLFGKEVFSEMLQAGEKSHLLNISNLKSGSYFLSIHSEKQLLAIEKIVVMK